MRKPIEELTLKEIRELKKQLADKIQTAVIDILFDFEQTYGIKAGVTDIWTEHKSIMTETGESLSMTIAASAEVYLQGEKL